MRITMNKPSPIREYRRLHDLRAQDLAGKLGISPITLRSYENGHRKIPAEFAVLFERTTGVPRKKLRPELFA